MLGPQVSWWGKRKRKKETIEYCNCLLIWQVKNTSNNFHTCLFIHGGKRKRKSIFQSLAHPSWEHLQQFVCVLLSTKGEQFVYYLEFLSNSIDQCPSFHNLPSHANSLCHCLCGQSWAHGLARGGKNKLIKIKINKQYCSWLPFEWTTLPTISICLSNYVETFHP